MLSDDCLSVLCDMFHITACTGISPAATSWDTCPLLPKKAGGHRLIGLFPMYQRVFMKLHVAMMRQWESAWAADSFMGAGSGRAPLDAV